ncbi:hypothetical protein [Streptomyces sp. NPDC048191]|uniref:hypothetical protein n=1 Tax=Streptomyces sp. NPDC048191 TaxID=3155484 RepID=UPI00340D5262
MGHANIVRQIGRLYAVVCMRTRRIVYIATNPRFAGKRAQASGAAQASGLHVPKQRRPAD